MKRILIAEDEKFLSTPLSTTLNKQGYEAVVADDGEIAVQMLQESEFDLLILDLLMPNKDGFEVLDDINEKDIKTPVLIVSNLSETNSEQRAKKYGVVGFMVKSNTSLQQIIEKIKEVVG